MKRLSGKLTLEHQGKIRWKETYHLAPYCLVYINNIIIQNEQFSTCLGCSIW
jgi:hypothetical protein